MINRSTMDENIKYNNLDKNKTINNEMLDMEHYEIVLGLHIFDMHIKK